jgi:hypothetical protein
MTRPLFIDPGGKTPVAQTKADRQAAAKKAAATRQRNTTRKRSQTTGKKAAATRQGNAAAQNAQQARGAAGQAIGGLTSAARFVGEAAFQAGKSVATRAGAIAGADGKKRGRR